jgi:thiol:disulfide interchange protein DsbD
MPLARFITAFIALSGLAMHAHAQGKPAPMKIEVFTETDAAHPGKPARVAVRGTLSPGLHAQSNKPLEDFLIPTVLSFEVSPDFATKKVVYPEAKMIHVEGSAKDSAVFEETFAVGVEIEIATSVAPGIHVLKGKLKYQACNEEQCFAPVTLDINLPIKIVDPATALTKQHEDIFKKINFEAVETAEVPVVALPTQPTPEPAPAIKVTGDIKSLLSGFEIVATGGGYMNNEEFLAFLDEAETGKKAASGPFAGMGPLLIALTILAGGLGLNLTPCVLPLIPINLMIIGAGAKASSRMRGFALGGAYGIGMAIAYGGLGLIVVLTTASFGALNASPLFNFAIAALFVLLSLAMFDVVQIDFSRFQSKIGLKKKEGGSYAIAFGMGVISALLAGACVAPAVIAVVLYSRDVYVTNKLVGIMLPFLLGIGMALPWPIAGAGLSFLPKPGKWMNRVKYIFGVAILFGAGYYAWIGYDLYNQRNVDPNEVAASANELTGGWSHSLEESLTKAKAERKLVVIDFWATWCKSCLEMNRTTLKDKDVIARLEKYEKVKYQAESPDESPAKDVLDNFPDYVGLPYFVVLRPKN